MIVLIKREVFFKSLVWINWGILMFSFWNLWLWQVGSNVLVLKLLGSIKWGVLMFSTWAHCLWQVRSFDVFTWTHGLNQVRSFDVLILKPWRVSFGCLTASRWNSTTLINDLLCFLPHSMETSLPCHLTMLFGVLKMMYLARCRFKL